MPRQRPADFASCLPAASAAAMLLAPWLVAAPALGQTSFLAPDGKNRFPAVTIFCPSGTGVAPCTFGGGSGAGGGATTLNLGGMAVSFSNRLPVSDPVIDALVAGGALSVGGTVSVSALPPVSLAGTPAVALSGALPAGGNAIGSVSVSNLPATQAVSGSVTVSALPALPAGSNTIGAVSISGTPTFTCSGCGGSGGGAVTQGAGSGANPWWIQGLGSAGTPAGGVVSMQGVAGATALPVSGSVTVSALPALPAGGNAIGSVGLVAGTVGSVTVAGTAGSLAQAVQGISGGVPLATSGSMSQSGSWTVGVSALPALPAGTNTIGTVSLAANAVGSVTAAGTGGSVAQSVQGIAGGVPLAVSGTLGESGSWTVGVSSLPPLPAGTAAIGQVSVSNLPATQAVSATSLPLPANAATASAQAAMLAPVAPGSATATSAVLMGCQASTTLPSFTAGQQGAVPCDTSGRPYVVTVPSANNVPGYLQAVSAGGASVYRAINAASSAMSATVKPSGGMVYGYEACNSGSSAAYPRLFALGTAPVVGTSVPQVSKLLAAGACQTMTTSVGLVFSGGIGMDVTSGSLADADASTVAAANQVTVSVYYK